MSMRVAIKPTTLARSLPEAGFMSACQMRWLLDYAVRNRARVILCSDTKLKGDFSSDSNIWSKRLDILQCYQTFKNAPETLWTPIRSFIDPGPESSANQATGSAMTLFRVLAF
jgi:hypothetical protein